jgi:hypothetical protein
VLARGSSTSDFRLDTPMAGALPSVLQAVANEGSGILAEFKRTAVDRTFMIQTKIDLYILCTCPLLGLNRHCFFFAVDAGGRKTCSAWLVAHSCCACACHVPAFQH